MRLMVVSVALVQFPVLEFRIASVGVDPQVLHTHLRGSLIRRTNGGAGWKHLKKLFLKSGRVFDRGPPWHSGYGAVLQFGRLLVRFQMVSIEFFIDIIPPDRTKALRST